VSWLALVRKALVVLLARLVLMGLVVLLVRPARWGRSCRSG
jgi:hypothetical protein